MAKNSRLHFTDEEIQEELRKLGYLNVSDDLFRLLKEDLSKLIEEEENELDSPLSLSAASQENTFMFDELSPVPCVRPIVINKSNTTLKTDVEQTIPKVISLDVPDINIKWTKTSAVVDVESSKENVNDSFSSSVAGRTIKRKVLRHRNGQTFISEKLYTPSTDSVFSTIDSCKSNPSTLRGASSELSHSVISSRSSAENNSEIRSQSQIACMKPHSKSNTARKCDPVTRYHQYRQYWETFKPPGEKSHKLLRWTIRERMLKYDFA